MIQKTHKYGSKNFFSGKKNSRKRFGTWKKHAEKRKNFTQYEIGDLVLIKANNTSDASSKIISKFLSLYEGSYKLEKKLSKNTFILINPKTNTERGQFHSSLFKKWEN